MFNFGQRMEKRRVVTRRNYVLEFRLLLSFEHFQVLGGKHRIERDPQGDRNSMANVTTQHALLIQ